MQEYNTYVQSINKIYQYLDIMKNKWNNQDNYNYIESIEEYKPIVIKYADIFKEKTPQKLEATSDD